MSTNALIAIRKKNKKVKFIQSSFDGGPADLGITLLQDYNSAAKAEKLIEQGDCEYPGVGHVDADKPAHIASLKKFVNVGDMMYVNHAYVWCEINKGWFYLTHDGAMIKMKGMLTV